MEKIKINNQTLNLMSQRKDEKKRYITISTELTASEIESAFLDVSRIEHYNDVDELLSIYTDGASLKAINHNLENGTYTIEIGTDIIEKRLIDLQKQIEVLSKV